MISEKIVVSGTGCALVDFLYKGINFASHEFLKYKSNNPGDGGLYPGKLVFTEELERFAGIEYAKILSEICCQKSPDALNVGGPSLVSLLHASQLLDSADFEVRFFGMAGSDEQYAIYWMGGKQVNPEFNLPKGNYKLEWLNPLTGKLEKKEKVSHSGGKLKLITPDYQEDIAL